MPEQSTAHPTIVSFLLDRTGSMEGIKDETISGFNGYLDALEREAGDLVAFTLLQFDSHSIDTLYTGAKLSEVARLTSETYQPRARTPLIDACVKTIKVTEETIARRRDKSRAGIEVIRSGVLGKVTELHVWTDRAGEWWPQGIDRPAPDEAQPDA